MPPLLALWLWIEKRHLENECVTSSPYESPVTGTPWEERYTSSSMKYVCSGAVSAAASGKLWNTRAPIHFSTIYCQSMVVEMRTESKPFLKA